MKLLSEQSRRTAQWVLVIIAISTIAAMTVTWRVPALRLAARDGLVRARGPIPPPEEIVIVAIDEASIRRYGRFPWPRDLMARGLDRLAPMAAKAVAINVLFSDATSETEDRALVESIGRLGNVVVAAQLVETPSRGAEWLRPLRAIEQAAAATGHGNVLTDIDGVARALTLREADDEGATLWATAVETIRVGNGLPPNEVREMPGAVAVGPLPIPVEAESPALTFTRPRPSGAAETLSANRMAVDYIGPAGSFAAHTVSIADLIDGRIPPERLRGKYVLIGATAAALGDRIASPFARAGAGNDTLMPGIEIFANALATMLRSRFYREASDWEAAAAAALVATSALLALSLASGHREFLRQTLALFGLILLILGLSDLIFQRWMVVPPVVPALVSFATAAPLGFLLRSLLISLSLDDRIIEMTSESTRLSPLALDRAPLSKKALWLPRGIGRKAHALAELQDRLMARTQFVDRALQSVEDGLLIADRSGRIAFSNARAVEILGVAERALLGSRLLDRLNEAEYGHDQPLNEHARKDSLSRLLDDRKPIERELILAATEPRFFTLRVAAVRDARSDDALGIVATLHDITRHRELQQMQSDVMTLVTHEMKTPLTAIKGMSEVLMKFEPDAAKRRRMHATINEASLRLTRMIDDYLDLTRLESGARAPRIEFLRIESLIERNLLLLDPVAAERGIRLLRELEPGPPPILADADLLTRALTNLVANAIKYSPANTDVVISTATTGESLLLSVSDQGCGIPPEHRARIFEKFFRVPRAENADTPGTGLGLALVREIAELHGGRVTVQSRAAGGSTFTLRLPLPAKSAAESRTISPPTHRRGMKSQ